MPRDGQGCVRSGGVDPASAEDASLLVNLPDGTWLCNDDTDGLDPQVLLSDPPEGQYGIWVGSYERGEFFSGTLSISELDALAFLTGRLGVVWPEY